MAYHGTYQKHSKAKLLVLPASLWCRPANPKAGNAVNWSSLTTWSLLMAMAETSPRSVTDHSVTVSSISVFGKMWRGHHGLDEISSQFPTALRSPRRRNFNTSLKSKLFEFSHFSGFTAKFPHQQEILTLVAFFLCLRRFIPNNNTHFFFLFCHS